MALREQKSFHMEQYQRTKNVSNFYIVLNIREKMFQNILEMQTVLTGSPKKHETWKTTWGLFIDILIRINGPSIKTNIRKICMILTEFYSNI